MQEYVETKVAETAEVDMLCDRCDHEITMGEDYYYDQTTEESLCMNCAEEQN